MPADIYQYNRGLYNSSLDTHTRMLHFSSNSEVPDEWQLMTTSYWRCYWFVQAL